MAKLKKVDRCGKGHKYTKENTYWQTKHNGKRYRQCKTCKREALREWQRRQPKKVKPPVTACRRGHLRAEFGVQRGDKKGWRCRLCDHETTYLSKFGLTLDDYDRMLEEQKGRCAICKVDTPAPRFFFSVDHDHESGEVRGLLCSPCNLGLGNFRDDPIRLRAAARYLARRERLLEVS